MRVPTAYENVDEATRISTSEIARHGTIKKEDRKRASNSYHLRHPPLAEVLVEPTQSEGINYQANIFGRSQDSLPNEPIPEDDHDSMKSAQEFADAFVNMARTNRPPDTMTTVEMTYDLSFVKALVDPQEFFEEEAALKK